MVRLAARQELEATINSAGGSSSSQSALNLSTVIQLRPHDKMKVEPSVITVPGYRTPSSHNWGAATELREAAMPVDAVSQLHMYTYEPAFDSEDFSWEGFLKTGSNLAEDLAQLATEFPQRPIIFIAHSLGGVLLKKALLLAHQNLQDPRFKLVVDCLCGILFLGTPHASVSDEETLLRHNQILFSCAKIAVSRQMTRLPRHDVFQLANLSATFEQIANIPVLSVFQYADPPSGIQKLFGKRSKALVDEQLATISSNAEHLLGVHLSHGELCKLPMLRNQTYSARDFLRSLFIDMAKNRRWPVAGLSPRPQPFAVDPLNPLNLAPIEPIDTNSTSKFTPSNMSQENRGFTRPPIELALRSSPVFSETNTERLLEMRRCRLPCFNVSHLPNRDFTGRQDILEIMDQYLLPTIPEPEGFASTRFFALCGMGGIGKTDVAIEYAHSRRHKFGAIFWLDSGGISQLTADFGQIANKLGLLRPDETSDLESNIKIAKAWLTTSKNSEGSENESWLLIFDNADNLNVITDYVPRIGNGSVLITSRDPSAKEDFFSDGTGIEMSPLSVDDSAALLRKLVARTAEGSTMDEQDASLTLATKFDGLPLAMTQMAGYIRRRRLSIREFISLYDTDARYAEIHNVSNQFQSHRYGSTLATAYNFQGLSAHATKLLQLLAFLNPDRVQETIFLSPMAIGGDGVGSLWTASTFENARYELLASSIVKRNIYKKELWIHRVIQAEVRTRIDEGRRYQIFKEATALLHAIWPPGNLLMQARKRWVVCEDLMPHLEQLFHLYMEYSDAWDNFELDVTFPILLNEMGVYLHERGLSHEGRPCLEMALSLCKRANISQEPLLSNMHLTMGALCNGLHDAQASLEHNIACLAIRKAESAKNKKPDVPLAFAYSQMGVSYMGVHKYALATEYFKQSVEILKSINAHYDELCFPICNLALAYWIQENYEEADTMLTAYWEHRKTLFGEIDAVSYKNARILHALGNIRASRAMLAQSRDDQSSANAFWEESFSIHNDAFKQYESAYGTLNRRIGEASHKLAEHYIRLGNHDKAQDLLDRALGIWGDWPWFRNEAARSSFLRGTHLLSMGGEKNIEMGNHWLERAKMLRREILQEAEPKELNMADFDKLVCFWSI